MQNFTDLKKNKKKHTNPQGNRLKELETLGNRDKQKFKTRIH